tara:strand:+ start:332 stop:1426 length:1095 start_codon:yes stop_codon:yes gene_type:complete
VNKKPVYVTKPSLAPFEEYMEILRGTWERGILTHNGPLVQKFESEIAKKLMTNQFVVVNNGTIAIQMAIKALELKGEIITTPFTWIATISAIKWENCQPVFCDIDPHTLNIDASKIESAITEKTVGIMPVHVFGNPCDVEEIEKIASKHNLKVIYDGAHAIGSTFKGKSVLEWGDISATSLHATKLLNTGEGGGCITTDQELDKKLRRIRFFGHNHDKTDIIEDGFNGKLTEIHAALGIANLKYYEQVIEDRKNKYSFYHSELQNLDNLYFQQLKFGQTNYSYFPIIFEKEEDLIKTMNKLQSENIFPRRYFYPSVNTFNKIINYQKQRISEDISKRILCLPLYNGLNEKKIESIISIVKKEIS